jgi:hypothetical protein
MIPNLLLILLGGAVADRSDRRALLIWLHLLATALAGAARGRTHARASQKARAPSGSQGFLRGS